MVSQSGRKLSVKKKAAFATIVAAAVLATPELLLRLLLFQVDVPGPATVCAWLEVDDRMQDQSFYLQPDPHSFYDLRPGAVYSYFGTRMDAINEDGFRGPAVSRDSDFDLRIACLGDSSTFGMCVSEPLTWVRQLEGLLREHCVGRHIEAINGGVIGFTVYQGLQKYRSKVRPFRPDVIVIAFGAINEKMPCSDAPDLQRAEYWDDAIGRHLGSAANWVWELRTVQLLGRPILERRQEQRREMSRQSMFHAVAFESGRDYVPRMSYDEFESCLVELINQVRNDDAVPVLVNPHRRVSTEEKYPQLLRCSEIILEVAEREQVALFDANALFQSDPDHETTLFADTHHPNAKGNRLLAESLTEFLAQNVLRSERFPRFERFAR